MRTYKTEGIIVKRRNIGEADRLVTVFTKVSGKIHAKAVGVRKIISRRSPHIELLNLSRLTLYQGKGIPIITEADSIFSFSEIKNNLSKVGFAYHICELIDGLCPESQENVSVFNLLKNSLIELKKSDDIIGITHSFEIELLTLLGFWPAKRPAQNLNTVFFIENILEKKLKTQKLLQKLNG